MTLTNSKLQRREFIRTALVAAGGVAALPAFDGLGVLGSRGRVSAAPGKGGYGPLIPTADLRDGGARMALPEGFQYRSFSVAGDMMSDGNRVPLAHDGMGVFNMPDGRFRLVRNHEDRNSAGNGSVAVDGNAYDRRGGGTTTLIVNPFTRELEGDFVSLSGTAVNCAGGVTPWGSWITSEETNVGPTATGWTKQHGYNFDVPAAANGTVPAVPLPAMGRFAHEAVAVDPETWVVYQTEDNGSTSGFYRFIANTPGRLSDGGTLEMLAIEGRFNYDTRTGQTRGVALPVTWVPIANPNPPGTGSTAVYDQGRVLGAARFARLEGCWYGNGAIYFDATSGGNAGAGQVWEYRPDGNGGTLTLIFESPSAEVLDSPDNLAVSPQGAILLCEDGDADQYVRGVTLDGEIFDFALNLQNDYEWAGATFAEAPASWNDVKIRGKHKPLGSRWDRVTLFVNRQGATSGSNPPLGGNEGMTFAIWGPWQNGAL
jgi:secreted PhoX family phosphatase